jgi:uncharacterized protein YyaL (SSP411 family)
LSGKYGCFPEEQDQIMKSKPIKQSNHLINESSPYLLQHSHNPVDWFPWSEEALDKAGNEQKLVLISIGYSACHWCHVMEEESFEDLEVAKFMNENFVSIKVDREERPDIDQIYMDAVQLITGRGGWPLNIITLPDGRPIFGGTYFPKENWLSMLSQVLNFVKENPDKAEVQAQSITRGVRGQELLTQKTRESVISYSDLDALLMQWQNSMDEINGGVLGAPKFPMPAGYKFLLHYHHLTGNQQIMDSINTTLVKMARGGIYDQIGGGFARYSTDKIWKVPHFEKMLYDNAQLVSLYSQAFQQTGNPLFKTIVKETLSFVERELSSESGGFYSSLDADSEGVEGKFYVWTVEQIKKVFPEGSESIIEYYNLKDSGNWEHDTNILYVSGEGDIPENLELTKKILLKEREKRIRPGLDDKILTSWNSLMITAYVHAYRAFDEIDYLTRALEGAAFIKKNVMNRDNRLSRNFKDGKSSINGFLDDYAFTIESFIALYEATFDEKWLEAANSLTAYVMIHFYNKEAGMFFYSSDLDPELITRKIDVIDNVIPSSNSQMAKNLFVLGHYYYKDDYILKSRIMLNMVKDSVMRGGQHFANWLVLMCWFLSEPYEVAILGENWEKIRKELDRNYLPDVFLSGGEKEGNLELLKEKLQEGKTTIYVCHDKVCQLPVFSSEAVLLQIQQ